MQGTRIIQSSGDPAIDAGALVAAQMSRYTPQMLACVPVRGTLVVSEKFGPLDSHADRYRRRAGVQNTRSRRGDGQSCAANLPEFRTNSWQRHGHDLVQVTIDANGNVANAQILKTSSLAALDQEALRVARASEYSPTIVNCTPQSADATLTITFAPDGPMVAGAAGNEAAPGCPTPNREPAIVEQVTPELSGIDLTVYVG